MPRIDISAFGERPGSVTVPGPDPARDARVDAYRDRERRRAARLLDRYLEVAYEVSGHNLPLDGSLRLNAAGDRFVEAVGDYVLSRLQQKSHYGVPAANPYEGKSIEELGDIMSSDGYRNPPQHNADSVVPGE
jgi:hypothetical protein